MLRIIQPWTQFVLNQNLKRSFSSLAIGFNRTFQFHLESTQKTLIVTTNAIAFLKPFQQQSIRTKKQQSSKGGKNVI
jgi:hypothetical protein